MPEVGTTMLCVFYALGGQSPARFVGLFDTLRVFICLYIIICNLYALHIYIYYILFMYLYAIYLYIISYVYNLFS